MEKMRNEKQGKIAFALCDAIHDSATYLSEIDGAIGDGDHGINMNKGFHLARERIAETMSFSDGMKVIGRTLVMDIGGSMGPIYGTLFSRLSKSTKNCKEIDKEILLVALQDALQGVMDLAGAKIGDKTLVDTLYMAIQAYEKAAREGADFYECLEVLKKGAEEGKESTKMLIAKIGRAARLGERSKGFLDAGATSCCIILKVMATEMQKELKQ